MHFIASSKLTHCNSGKAPRQVTCLNRVTLVAVDKRIEYKLLLYNKALHDLPGYQGCAVCAT